MLILLCEVCQTPIEYNRWLGIHCPKCNNPTPTPPEEPSGVEEAAEQYARSCSNDNYFSDAFKAGAKWQSTHNTPEWPSEERIHQAAIKYGKENNSHQPDVELAIDDFEAGIQWLKSILNK